MNILPNMLEFTSGRKAIEFFAMQAGILASNANQTVRIEITMRGISLSLSHESHTVPADQCVYASPRDEEIDLIIRIAAMIQKVALDIGEVPTVLNADEIALCRASDRIKAIKSIRERAGRKADGSSRMGLREAKDMTDAYYAPRPPAYKP